MHSIFCTESNLRREVTSRGSKELLRVSVKCLKKLASSLEILPYEKMLKNGTLGRELKSHISHLSLTLVLVHLH